MNSVKLSITSRARLEKKYDARALADIDKAVAVWVRADKARDITTVHVAVDDRTAMKRLGVAAVTGTLTAPKVKVALDALVARLSPDYIVLFGAHDVLPMFLVKNPSASETGDDDDQVPTDNPYACSRPYSSGQLKSYLVPDRVVGRIADLPGSHDPSWVTSYLRHATGWRSRPSADYRSSLMLCTFTWRQAGAECAKTLGHDSNDVLICPPTKDGVPQIQRRRRTRLHMIKCHGADEDSHFYGERNGGFPDALSSPTLVGKTVEDTVVGAMCCYGADLFDPTSPNAQHKPELPIPSVYLKQGAHGFLGSSTIAWVGSDTMMCADWIVTAFLKGATGGASLGRAALEAKQDFLRWLQQQGQDPDVADEKTLIQFSLLGDPSIQPVVAAAPAGGPRPAGRAGAKKAAAAALPAAAVQRRKRRAARHEIGGMLRSNLAARDTEVNKTAPKDVKAAARRVVGAIPHAAKIQWQQKPRAHRLMAASVAPELTPRAAAAIGGAARQRAKNIDAARQTYQYYWTGRQKTDDGVRRISLVTVQADSRGRVLGSRIVVSS
jgi:hypothetical protein